MIAIIDYGVGNLFSLSSSLSYLGLENKITRNADDIIHADRIILPGVGAFGDAIEKLRQTGLIDTIKAEVAKGKPMLGICLGMQLLFDKSYEYGEHEGLGLIHGEVCDLNKDLTTGLKVPEMGWNSLNFVKDHPILKYVKNGDYVYYVHSYYAKNCDDSLVAYSEYEVKVPGVVSSGSVVGTQFHPEKSGAVGLAMLKAFAEM
ncbi:MAG: imidazole glycerol phosphate synthase subunit HisH [Firmicutes bacterium]|nr:imidazole glycerol phosphate synthase subunit HisH [Bacillota bacterium]